MINKEYTKLPIAKIFEYKFNNKNHPAEQIISLKKSITEFGQVAPVEVDENYIILAGHGRLVAMQELDYTEVDVIVISGLTEAQKKAYRIASNKIADLAIYNQDNLRYELEQLDDMLSDLTVTGFSLEEIERLMHDIQEEDNGPAVGAAKPKTTKINITCAESFGDSLINDINTMIANKGYTDVEVNSFTS